MFKRSETILSYLVLCVLVWVVPVSILTVEAAESAVVAQSEQAGDVVKSKQKINSPALEANGVRSILEEVHRQRAAHGGNPLQALVPIIGTIAIFGMPVFIVALVLWSKNKRRQLMHQTLSQMIEKGVEVPPHFFVEDGMFEGQRMKRSALHKGLISTAIGLGIIGFFLTVGAPQVVGIGLIPLFIGLAYLLIWKLEEKAGKQ